jgi:hypothetical protein
MTDFDLRLQERLRRLEGAIPEAPLPRLQATRRANRGRQVFLLVAAAAALLIASTLAAVATQPPPDPAVVAKNAADEERVRNDIAPLTEGRCVGRQEAADLVRRRLDALGLTDWNVRVDDRIREARCVTFAAIGDDHEVLMIASMGGDVANALDNVADQLLRECLSRDEAFTLIRSTLETLGVSNPNIQSTGIRQVPVPGDAYLEHFRNGCAVYGGAQFDSVGRYTWFISGG